MTIQEVFDILSKVPKDKRNMPLYVCDLEYSDNHIVKDISLYDNTKEHDKENILAIDFN